MQKVIALIVIFAVSFSLSQSEEFDVYTDDSFEIQSKAVTENGSANKETENDSANKDTENDSAANSIKFVIPFFKANWYKAVEHCNYLGQRLAVIDTQGKETQLYAAIKASDIYTNDGNFVWVGANDLADEGNFHWHGTGRRVVYANWGGSQPDNANRGEHCVEIGQFGYSRLSMKWLWNDRDCMANRYFVCEDYKQ